MLVLSSVANREAHPSPRVLVGETLQVSNFNPTSCLCFLGLMFLYMRFTNLVKDVDPIWGCLVRVVEPVTVSHLTYTLVASVYIINFSKP